MKTIRKTILILTGILLLAFVSSCTEYDYDIYATITGKVLDADTMQPIENVNVYITPTSNNYMTLSDGCFEFAELDAAQYTITVQKSGYSGYAVIISKYLLPPFIFVYKLDDRIPK